jgi:hypothetical protein
MGPSCCMLRLRFLFFEREKLTWMGADRRASPAFQLAGTRLSVCSVWVACFPRHFSRASRLQGTRHEFSNHWNRIHNSSQTSESRAANCVEDCLDDVRCVGWMRIDDGPSCTLASTLPRPCVTQAFFESLVYLLFGSAPQATVLDAPSEQRHK